MPPLPPNLSRAGVLRTMPAWNQRTSSRRDNHTRFLTKRFPVKPSSDTNWVNPSLPPGASRLAQPIGSTGHRHRRPIIPPVTPEWLLLYTAAPLQARDEGAPPGAVSIAYDVDAFALGYPNVSGETSGARAYEYNDVTDTFVDVGNVLSGTSSFYLEYARSLALAVNSTLGTILAVGVPNGNGNLAGAVQTLALTGATWTAVDTISYNYAPVNGMEYGSSVSISAYDEATTAYYLAIGGPGSDAAQVAKLQSGGALTGFVSTAISGTGAFGTSVSISDYLGGAMRVAIGAPDGTNGFVRIIELSGGSWTTQATITVATSNFGNSVSLSSDGTVLAVGDPQNGIARVYYDDGGTWTLLPGGALTGQSSSSLFGTAVSVDRDASSSDLNGITVAVGEPEYSIPARTKTGRVCVMEHLSGDWVQVLSPIVGLSEFERFGESVALAPGGQKFVAGGSASVGRTAVYGTEPLGD
jgi:hypothetical protein